MAVKTPVVALIIVAMSAGGCASPDSHTASESAATMVTVTRATVEDVASSFEAGGVVRSRASALIASRVLAPIAQVHVRAGDRVRRGTTLVTLDAQDIHAEKARAEAAFISAAEIARAATGDIRAAESALTLARATHDRIASLHAKRSATAQELDQAVAALTAAEAQRASAQSRLAAAEAAQRAAQASASAAAITATYTLLSAPFEGIVTERRADPGSMAAPGSPLLVLEDPTTYRLEVQVDEARAVFVRPGQLVSVRIDSAPDGDDGWVNAHVTEIARIDPASHTFLVKIDLPPTTDLRSGLFGRARFPGPSRRALTVPSSTLIRRGQLTFVYVVDAEQRVRLRPISTGTSSLDRAEVLAGLRDGDAVVTDPPASLIDGALVTGAQR
jgi:multidrug efflux pump subunit AcrA (membrane-fusion protein)